MAKYRKKPVEIDTIQWTGDNYDEIYDFVGQKLGRVKIGFSTSGAFDQLIIPTLEGEHRADVGDWIIKGVKGEFYPCKPDIFKQTYEPVLPKMIENLL